MRRWMDRLFRFEPQFNYDDPFGHEWAKDEDTGMVVLQPGQSTQWKIRLEIFSLSSTDTTHVASA